jgi:hypothetical protein
MENLWPEDITTSVDLNTPVELLQQQASYLGEMTKNELKGIVGNSDALFDKGEFKYEFYINAPTLGNYSYKLFSISHDIDLYPVNIFLENEMIKEILGDRYTSNIKAIKCSNEAHFIGTLGRVFAAKRTRNIITSLLQMTKVKLSSPTSNNIPS